MLLKKPTSLHMFNGLFSRTTWVSRHQKAAMPVGKNKKVPVFHWTILSSIFMHLLFNLFFLFLNFCQLVSENLQIHET